MPKKITITAKELEAIDQKLATLPEVKPEHRHLSLRETIEKLKPRIKELRDKGYTIEMIAEQLGKAGIKLMPSTVKMYARGLHIKEKKRGIRRS